MTAKETLGESFYPDHCGGLIECVTLQNALKAVKDYARQKCEEQRKICSEQRTGCWESDGSVSYAPATPEMILNAPEPSFD
jgi:hypothetical protein